MVRGEKIFPSGEKEDVSVTKSVRSATRTVQTSEEWDGVCAALARGLCACACVRSFRNHSSKLARTFSFSSTPMKLAISSLLCPCLLTASPIAMLLWVVDSSLPLSPSSNPLLLPLLSSSFPPILHNPSPTGSQSIDWTALLANPPIFLPPIRIIWAILPPPIVEIPAIWAIWAI